MEDGRFDDALQQEIKLGIEHNVDVSLYKDPAYSWYQMHMIRLGMESGYDTRELIKDFDWSQIEEILAGYASGVDVEVYKKPIYMAPQMQEIRIGLEKGLDVSLYTNEEFNCSR